MTAEIISWSISTKVRVGIKPDHKAKPGGFYRFCEGGFWGFYGFYVGFINLKVYHDSHNQLLPYSFFCAISAGLKRNSLFRIKAVCISVCILWWYYFVVNFRMITKNCWDTCIPKLRKITVVLFWLWFTPLGQKLSNYPWLLKLWSNAVMLVLVTKVWIYFNAVVLGNGNLFTIWNRIIYTYTAHQSKLALKFSFTANMIKQ